MKYFSDILNKVYNTEKECKEAEEQYLSKKKAEEEAKQKLTEKRKERAKEVEEAFKNVREAQKHYDELLKAFVKDYGSFHMSFSESGASDTLSDILTRFFG